MSAQYDTKRGSKRDAQGDPKRDAKSELKVDAEAPDLVLPKGVKIYPIVKYGNSPVLEQRAAPVEKFDDELHQLCADMFISMYAANGVGLAAPQIGLGIQLSVIDTTTGKNPNAKIVIANPEIIHMEGEQREEEGCLSLPGFRANVLRPLFVTVRAQDIYGKQFEMRGENMLARAFCHEIDHLHGVLFIQHVSMLKRDLIKRRIRKMRKAGDW
ncbi:MAG TPA: peptide deformylase [Candidatus Acidoferrales bacterium]|jgi:peptide deformylase|nr:peptide deformylase [Candidatus Acidoferrales bacterium]